MATPARLIVCASVLLVAWSAAILAGQPASTPEELDTVMKRAGPAMRETQKVLKSGAPDVSAEVRAQVAIMRRSIVDSADFWIQRSKEDAIKMNRDALAKLDAFDQVLAADPLDRATAMTALRAVDGACRACHKIYRDTDADDNYIITPGSIGH
jgi:cytochrome c556